MLYFLFHKSFILKYKLICLANKSVSLFFIFMASIISASLNSIEQSGKDFKIVIFISLGLILTSALSCAFSLERIADFTSSS